jgi:hypothetical protein
MNTAVVAVLSAAVGAGVAAAVILATAKAPVSSTPSVAAATPGIRIIEAGRDAQGCDAGEELLGAYCVSSPPNGISASTVAFRKTGEGTMSLSCFTGGSQMRIVCMRSAK